jgi:hypothetical protein
MTADAARIAADLTGHQNLMLLCLASGANWRRAGITVETADGMVARGLIEPTDTTQRFRLTPLGRDVLAALLAP